MPNSKIAWSSRVSREFLAGVIVIANELFLDDPSWLMACMAFETDETFSPSIRNASGSGAIGLIQFMPQTAAALGTSVEELAAMTAEQQLQYVGQYFHHWAARLHNLGDVYSVILWPRMIGKSDDYVVFSKDDPDHPRRYLQNKGLDFNEDGVITRGEIIARVQRELEKGYAVI